MKTSFFVQNLKCGGCAKTITSKLEKLPHISNVEVNVDSARVSFEHLQKEDLEMVMDNLKSLGYPPQNEQNSLSAKARSLVSCATGSVLK